ncbi:MAG TPA: toprim domain-containing protein [Oscillospiraceae bacterium]|nr:toprim domain-containing protein [Oscillospiraceae bacterium]
MAKKQEYGNESIHSLKGADRIRKRPAVVFGSDGVEGCEHAIFEIISNAIDEARAGYGDRVVITRYNDGSVEVEDFGRGCPVDYNPKEQRYNWELLFCELYAGGKYDAEENYEYSLGLNGLGLCATQYASEWMEAEICRDGYLYHLRFEHGENIGGLQREPTTRRKTGSRIRWKPDREVFTDTDVPEEWYADTVKRQAVVNAGLLFILKNQKPNGSFENTETCYENGIADYVRELIGEGPSLTGVQFWQGERTGRDREDKPDYKVKIQAACCFSNRIKVIEYYHNSSWLEHGGSPEKAVKSAFVSQIDAYIKSAGKYLKNESRISFQDVEDCLVLVISSFSSQTSYENQTKKAINNKFIAEGMTDFLKHQLEVYFIENPDDAARVAEQVLINKRSRENAERTRLNLKKKLAGTIDMTNRVEKFVDCRTKDVARREIYIVEGDSALGACKQGRDADFQAIIPVRGKILNCLKADYDKIFKSDVITDLIKVLGCGVEVKTKANKEFSTFDLENLRWNKVIICTDADVDGFQIRTLILTMLYRLTPTLIDEGLVFIAESPLYEIICGDESYFAWTDDEKDRVVQKLGNKKFSVQRSKGLGENEPDMMWLTTMNPETRRLIKIMPSDMQATADKFDLLLGDNLSGRKDHIAENGYLYLDDMDVS